MTDENEFDTSKTEVPSLSHRAEEIATGGGEAGRRHTGTHSATDRPQGESTARDSTGVDPQESITRDDPSNAAFHDQVVEETGD